MDEARLVFIEGWLWECQIPKVAGAVHMPQYELAVVFYVGQVYSKIYI